MTTYCALSELKSKADESTYYVKSTVYTVCIQYKVCVLYKKRVFSNFSHISFAAETPTKEFSSIIALLFYHVERITKTICVHRKFRAFNVISLKFPDGNSLWPLSFHCRCAFCINHQSIWAIKWHMCDTPTQAASLLRPLTPPQRHKEIQIEIAKNEPSINGNIKEREAGRAHKRGGEEKGRRESAEQNEWGRRQQDKVGCICRRNYSWN